MSSFLLEDCWCYDRFPVGFNYGMDSPTSEVLLLSEDDSGLLVNTSFSTSSASSSSNKYDEVRFCTLIFNNNKKTL